MSNGGAAFDRALRRYDQRRTARLFGIAGKGRIAVGYDADFTIVDLKRRETIIEDRWIASRAGWTPYRWQVTSPAGRWGQSSAAPRVMWEGEIVAPARGEAVRFWQSL